MNKDYCPGYFDLAAGGMVCAGEDEDKNAEREVHEELGIPEDEIDLNFLFKFKYDSDHSKTWIYSYFFFHEGRVKA